MKIKAELGKEGRMEALQPHVQMWRLYSLLRLASKKILTGLFLSLEKLTPTDKFGVDTVQAEQSW